MSDSPVVITSTYQILYADTDAMGVVYNAQYLRIFESGRVNYLLGRGLSYKEVEARGFSTPVTEAYAHYYLPFRYEDQVQVETWVSHLKKASFRFDYRLVKAEEPGRVYVSGHTVHALTDHQGKITRVPDWLLTVLQ